MKKVWMIALLIASASVFGVIKFTGDNKVIRINEMYSYEMGSNGEIALYSRKDEAVLSVSNNYIGLIYGDCTVTVYKTNDSNVSRISIVKKNKDGNIIRAEDVDGDLKWETYRNTPLPLIKK